VGSNFCQDDQVVIGLLLLGVLACNHKIKSITEDDHEDTTHKHHRQSPKILGRVPRLNNITDRRVTNTLAITTESETSQTEEFLTWKSHHRERHSIMGCAPRIKSTQKMANSSTFIADFRKKILCRSMALKVCVIVPCTIRYDCNVEGVIVFKKTNPARFLSHLSLPSLPLTLSS